MYADDMPCGFKPHPRLAAGDQLVIPSSTSSDASHSRAVCRVERALDAIATACL
jgi:hypothetical protein